MVARRRHGSAGRVNAAAAFHTEAGSQGGRGRVKPWVTAVATMDFCVARATAWLAKPQDILDT